MNEMMFGGRLINQLINQTFFFLGKFFSMRDSHHVHGYDYHHQHGKQQNFLTTDQPTDQTFDNFQTNNGMEWRIYIDQAHGFIIVRKFFFFFARERERGERKECVISMMMRALLLLLLSS